MEELDYNLFAKCLSGEATLQEKEAMQKWINESDDNKKLYTQYQYFYQNSKISESVDTSSLQKYQNPKRNYLKQIIAVAASIALILTLAYVLSQQDFASNSSTSIAENKLIIKSNPKGQKSNIMLPDGSRVWLNSDSQLQYHENFTDSTRLVSLSGEAFFEVVKDSLRPFVVKANDLQTTVLGTSFNIAAFPHDENTVISLLSGKLKVTSEDHSTYLEPGDQARQNTTDGSLSKRKINIDEIALWKDGILQFEKERFSTVIYRLERWYGVDIIIQGQPSTQWRFTGYFENENLKNVLEVLSFGKNINFKIEGKNVRLMMN